MTHPNGDAIAATRVFLMRHGECEGGHIFRGSTDVALNAEGWQTLRSAAAAVPAVTTVYTSPMQRCRQFAEQFAGEQAAELIVERDLREMHFGIWEGRLIDDVAREQPGAYAAWKTDPSKGEPPEAERLSQLVERTGRALDAIVAARPGQTSLAVCHGGVMRVLLCRVLGMPLADAGRIYIPYGCVTELALFDGTWGFNLQLIRHNFAAMPVV